MLPLLAPLAAKLASNGLGMIADAVLKKGKDVVEKTLGVDLEDSVKSEQGLIQLQQLQADHEETLLKLAIEKDKEENRHIESMQANTTERWTSDNLHGHSLAKIVRPASLVFILVMYTIFALTDGNIEGFNIKPEYVKMLEWLSTLVFPAYFGLKSFEKVKVKK